MHTQREKKKLLARVRRIRGQLEALERALEAENECSQVMMLIASVRGAINGLMGEVIEDHLTSHVLQADTEQARREGAQELIEVLRAYLR